ncbi:hypothetical protein ABZY81_34505 [Streptomyces sp. NPDC006514]|uniref:hypothetical protein n=1 Tax=Streptomyces sp. NPDC006514 TaxID=3154308 RepID=UPI0033A7A8BC
MRGIERLRRHDIPFSAVAAVSDPALEHAARFYEFFAELGVTTLGVNIEEEEGVNRAAKDTDPVRATEFWAALADAWRTNPVIRLREIQRVLNFAGAVLGSHDTAPTPTSAPWDPMPTIAYDGGAITLSPALSGFTDARFGDFTTGNVLQEGLDVLVAEAGTHPLDLRVLAGRRRVPRRLPRLHLRLRLLLGCPRREQALRARRPVRRGQDPVLHLRRDRPTRRSHACPFTRPLTPPRIRSRPVGPA